MKQDFYEAMTHRLKRFEQPEPPHLLQGDANSVVRDIMSAIPSRALALAFLDPHGLHLDFDTLRKLSRRRVDLIIFFPDFLDALRNWRTNYQGKEDSSLTRVLGTGDWEPRMHTTPPQKQAALLLDIYIEQIRGLGYHHFESERITRPDGVFLYKLLFCSNHPTGARIWRGISKREAGGQGRLW